MLILCYNEYKIIKPVGGAVKKVKSTLNLCVKEKFKAIIMILVSFSLILIPYDFSQAATLNDLQKQKADINSSIQSKTQQSNQKSQDITQYNKDLQQLNNDISDVEGKISDTQSKVDQTNNDIKTKEQEISQKENELSNEKENQNEALRVMYENNEQNTFELVMGSNTLSEVVDQADYIQTLENRIETTIDTINKLKSDLEKQKSDLENKKKDLSNLQQQQQAYKTGLGQQQNQKNKLLSDTQNQKKSLDQQVKDAQKMGAQVEAQINAALSANKSSGRTVIARDRGTSAVGFSWPMDYKYISAYFGDSTPFQSFHSGIDLVNVIGTPIYAAADGTVITATGMMIDGNYYGYGNYIIIGHNARYSSLYGHLMSFAVTVGDEVKKGDIIGYEGLTGWTTGPHLHFEIRENGSVVNPVNYLP